MWFHDCHKRGKRRIREEERGKGSGPESKVKTLKR